ncbi:MAG: DUF2339 domain-containing protein [Gloeobacteraceae cyanobacterium ES-bin-316]|nr:DUF2339 domain-containing protein [Ferruginibacter sp.]
MEALLFIAFIIIIILLLGIRSAQKKLAEKNNLILELINKQLHKIKEAGVPVTKPVDVLITREDIVQWRPEKPITKEEKSQDPTPAPTVFKEERINPVPVGSPPVTEKKISAPPPPSTKASQESWSQKWLRNNPDLEKFVGENLVNKIGITVLVLGIAFFVKYAIDQNWITEVGRVCIGLGCGIILVGIAHFLRNSFRSFSSVLAGGGIAVFYFTIAFAYHQYQLFSQSAAFIIMIFITVFAVLLALLYNKIELATIALVGGFIAPFLVSEGSGNYISLFTYLLVLNIGILLIAFFKKWPLLLALAFFFTWLIFGGWLVNVYAFGSSLTLPCKNALLFASAFYIIFLTASLVNNLRNQKPFKRFDFSFLLTITFSYYAWGMFILSYWDNGSYKGIFTIILAMLNLCLSWYLFKTQKGDKNLLYLLIGLTLTFVSLAAPVQLHGHTITLFWSAETVLLYWLYQRSGIRIFKYSSALLLFLMGASLMMDWSIADERSTSFLPVIFNSWQGIITNIVAAVSLLLYTFLLQKNTQTATYIFEIKTKYVAAGTAILAVLICYATSLFGVNLYYGDLQSFDIPNTYHQLITNLFVLICLRVTSRLKTDVNSFPPVFLILACFAFYLFSSSLSDNLMQGVIENKYATFYAVIHWCTAASMLGLLYFLVKFFRANTSTFKNASAWMLSIILLLFLSLEAKRLYITLFAEAQNIAGITSQYQKAGLTIVWAIFSFVIIWLGMKYKYKTLRIIALSIFSIALIKLFLFDIRNISEGGKIAAFIMLGILLLVISFMYQRLKKIIIDNEEKTN